MNMPRRSRASKKSKRSNVPISFDSETYERIQRLAEEVGEADAVVIRLLLRAGLAVLDRKGARETFPELVLGKHDN